MNNYVSPVVAAIFTSNREDVGSGRESADAPRNWIEVKKVLVLDGNTRSALAATRSLGRRGVPVVVADETKRTLSGASKYCSESFSYPSPTTNLRGFLSTVKAECSQRGIRVIFPMTEISMATLLKHEEEFREFEVPFAKFSAFDA